MESRPLPHPLQIIVLKNIFVFFSEILANQKLCYIQILLNIEKSGEQDQESSEEWLVNTNPGLVWGRVVSGHV